MGKEWRTFVKTIMNGFCSRSNEVNVCLLGRSLLRELFRNIEASKFRYHKLDLRPVIRCILKSPALEH